MDGRKKTMKATLSMMPFLRSENFSHSMSVRTWAPLSSAYAEPSINSEPYDMMVVSSAQTVGLFIT